MREAAEILRAQSHLTLTNSYKYKYFTSVITLDIRHPEAYRKVIQVDTSDMLQSRRLNCEVNLHLRPVLHKPTFDEELILAPPLSVVWFDRKRNLFNVNPYLHQQSVADVKRQLSQQ